MLSCLMYTRVNYCELSEAHRSHYSVARHYSVPNKLVITNAEQMKANYKITSGSSTLSLHHIPGNTTLPLTSELPSINY